MRYGADNLAMKKSQEEKLEVARVRMLIRVWGDTKLDRMTKEITWIAHRTNLLTFRRRLLERVADLAETFPPPDSIFPTQLQSSSRALPSIFISTTARMFYVSSLLLTCPNHSSLLLLITIAIGSTFASSKISSFLLRSNRPTPIAHRTILIYVVAICFSSLTDIGHVSQPYSKVDRITVQYIRSFNFIGIFLSQITPQFSPFRPCLRHSALHVFAGSYSSVYRWLYRPYIWGTALLASRPFLSPCISSS